MRTTVTPDQDVQEKLRAVLHERGVSIKQALTLASEIADAEILRKLKLRK